MNEELKITRVDCNDLFDKVYLSTPTVTMTITKTRGQLAHLKSKVGQSLKVSVEGI